MPRKPKILATKIPPEIASSISKPHKYQARPTWYGGRKYPSKAQADRAHELDILLRAGEIAWWLPEVPIMIGEPRIDRPYRVDFLVCEEHRPDCFRVWAEDIKGVETQSFHRHVRQWQIRGPFPLHIIHNGKETIIPGKRR